MAGKPSADAVDETIKERFRRYFEDHDGGGSLHWLPDEQKLDTRTVEKCLRSANIEEDTEGADLCRILLTLSMAARQKILEDFI